MTSRGYHAGAPAGRRPRVLSVQVYRSVLGRWEVVLGRGRQGIRCETLEEARRVAHLAAENAGSCELTVRDAYNRVLHHELIGDAAESARGTSARQARS